MPSTVVTSNEITVAGLGTSVTARFSSCRFAAPSGLRDTWTTTGTACTLVKNGADVSGSSTTVANGDRIAVKVKSNSVASGIASVKVTIGTDKYGPWFHVITRPTAPPQFDTIPDQLGDFTRQYDAAPGTVVTSNELTVAGLVNTINIDGNTLTRPVTAQIGFCRFDSPVYTTRGAACTLVKNGADVSGSSTTVANGDRIAVKVKSNSAGSGSAKAGVYIGGYLFAELIVLTRPTVTLALSPTWILENGGVSTVTATLSGASSEAVTVTVSATPVAPAASGDYMLSTAHDADHRGGEYEELGEGEDHGGGQQRRGAEQAGDGLGDGLGRQRRGGAVERDADADRRRRAARRDAGVVSVGDRGERRGLDGDGRNFLIRRARR